MAGALIAGHPDIKHGTAVPLNRDGRDKPGHDVVIDSQNPMKLERQPFTSTGPVPCGRSFSLMMPRRLATSV